MQYQISHLLCNKDSHNTLLDFFVLTFLRYHLFISSFERRQHVWSKIYGNILCEISSSTLLSPMLHFYSPPENVRKSLVFWRFKGVWKLFFLGLNVLRNLSTQILDLYARRVQTRVFIVEVKWIAFLLRGKRGNSFFFPFLYPVLM